MEETLLEVREYQGPGYQPLVDFGEWRVAILRFLDGLQPDRVESMERHLETDEVFALVCGRGVMLVGGNGPAVDRVRAQVMEAGKVYNVKRGSWHSILLTEDGAALVIENRDTGAHNSEKTPLSAEHRRAIAGLGILLAAPRASA
ncbi:MAG TPA: hypothetical protein VFF68_12565 [Anaerolineaceae bacterium]|nr:hypothetical protein [Anaerolineaceae bacterium]